MSQFNIASLLTEAARRWPGRAAVICPHRPDVLGRGRLTYKELDEASGLVAAHLGRCRPVPGSRVIVMVKPGLDFFTVIFGLFKAGLPPVMVDPGMGAARMLRCLAEGRPGGIVGLPAAHLLSLTAPRFFRSIKLRVTVGRRLGWGGATLAEIMRQPAEPGPAAATGEDDVAAILFTSGSTGPAKGAIYTHAMFRAQVEAIKNGLDIQPGGLDLATFPMFGLFAPALGLTSVIPDINAAKPGRADPAKLIKPIMELGVTSMFASPTLLGHMAAYAHEKGLSLPSLRRVILAGAPVQPRVAASFRALMPGEATLQTPYGATEGVPLSTIESREIAGETRRMTEQGLGMCVGRALRGVDLKVIRITDSPIARLTDDLPLPVGEIGEIIARGPMVSPGYFERPRETSLAVIKDGATFWHRMGDVGWLDSQNRLWFCGRKAHRVVTAQGTLFSVPCEAIFNNHPQVRRSALVGVGPRGRQKPVMVIEPQLRRVRWEALVEELLALAKANPRTIPIADFLLCRSLPVDVRHNAKINREKLAQWAAGQTGIPEQ